MTMLETFSTFRRRDHAGRRVAVRKIAQSITGEQELREDFLGRQVTHQLLRAGVTERTGECAADLAGNAMRAAALFGNIDGLDLDRPAGTARGKTQEPLSRAVIGDLFVDDLVVRDGEMLLQHFTHVLGNVRHVVEIGMPRT